MSIIKDRKVIGASDWLAHSEKIVELTKRINSIDIKSTEGPKALCTLLETPPALFDASLG
jgi:hypothetical protein